MAKILELKIFFKFLINYNIQLNGNDKNVKNLLRDNEFEKRFLYIERDLIQKKKFSIAKSELGKIIHDAKIKNHSEVLDKARRILRFCNIKERELENGIEEEFRPL